MKGFKGFNSGCLLYGDCGVGKSGIMSYLTAWAHDSNWIVVNVPHATKIVSTGLRVQRLENGLYMQEEVAQ